MIVTEPFDPKLSTNKYQILKKPNASWDTIDQYREIGANYFIVNEYVYGEIKIGAQENHGNNFQYSIKRYNNIFDQSNLVYEIQPNKLFSTEDLLYKNDFLILKTLQNDLLKGPFVKIYKIKDN